ncbi:anillin-like [Wyeomyia smithii]|uniref:anillin-like n=1 Tax=Wyeomyia smithii TaxID=174621 RepID=UPI002467E892|nr:anillin-like [Wyeomyia smithii]
MNPGSEHGIGAGIDCMIMSFAIIPILMMKNTSLRSEALICRSAQKVTIAPRLVCLRLNKLLKFRRPPSPDDVESLVLAKQGNPAIQRNLLSADCCDEWCAHLNKTLALLEAWGQTDSRSSSC